MAEVLDALRAVAPRDACIVTDSGLHQMTTRTWWTALAPRAFITPADFQSMGFGLPAAVDAAIGSPGRTVIAVIGDGGLAMSAMELATAVREGVRLVVVVCNDRGFGLIRRQQLLSDGVPFAVDFPSPDIGALAAALSADSETWPSADLVGRAMGAKGVFVVELVLGEHSDMQRRVTSLDSMANPSLFLPRCRWGGRRAMRRAPSPGVGSGAALGFSGSSDRQGLKPWQPRISSCSRACRWKSGG